MTKSVQNTESDWQNYYYLHNILHCWHKLASLFILVPLNDYRKLVPSCFVLKPVLDKLCWRISWFTSLSYYSSFIRYLNTCGDSMSINHENIELEVNGTVGTIYQYSKVLAIYTDALKKHHPGCKFMYTRICMLFNIDHSSSCFSSKCSTFKHLKPLWPRFEVYTWFVPVASHPFWTSCIRTSVSLISLYVWFKVHYLFIIKLSLPRDYLI